MISGFKRLLVFVLISGYSASAQIDAGKVLDVDSLEKGLIVLDSQVLDYSIFFSGENHSYAAANNKFESGFLSYLIQKAGVRHFFLEAGYVRGLVLNNYVQTGDSSSYKMLKVGSYPVFVELYEDLRELYLKFADSGITFQIHGIDIERSTVLPFAVLESLLPEDKYHLPQEIYLSIESIRAIAESNRVLYKRAVSGLPDSYSPNSYMENFALNSSLDSIIQEFRLHEDVYIEYLKENFDAFNKIIISLEEGQKWRLYNKLNLIQRNIFRENSMLKKFEILIDSFPDDKFYGQMGRCHTSRSDNEELCGWHGFASLVKRLNNLNNPNIKDKVFSVGIFYNSDLKRKNEAENKEVFKYFDVTPNGSIYLYRLSMSDTIMATQFNYIIIDRKSQTTELTYFRKKKEDVKSFHEDLDFIDLYEFGFQQNFYFTDINNLNASLSLSGNFHDFNTTFISKGMYFNFSEIYRRSGSNIGTGFSFLSPQRRDLGKDTILRLTGYNIDFRGGYIYKLHKSTYITFGGEISFFQRRLVQSVVMPDPFLAGFEESNEVIYKKPAFVFTPFASLKLVGLGIMFINIEGGVCIDMSSPDWKSKGKYISTSPTTRWHSPYFGFKIGVGSREIY